MSILIAKSIPLTLKILHELIDLGVIMEAGYAVSGGGRPPVLYMLRVDAVYTLAVSMDQFITRISIMDIYNRHLMPIAKFEIDLARDDSSLDRLADAINSIIAVSPIDKEKILGIGIGMPGFIDLKRGVNLTFLKRERGASIVDYISERTHMPVFIDNDSRLVALAEYRFGMAKFHQSSMVINIGWGIGLGMVINGEIFGGYNGFAGEFSHIALFNNNKLCSCGKIGCLQTEASLLVMMEKAEALLRENVSSYITALFPTGDIERDCEVILNAAVKGDRLSVNLLSEIAYNIGRGVSILLHLMNPECVVVSGRGARGERIWLPALQRAINEHCIPQLVKDTKVVMTSLNGYEAELIGASALVIESRIEKNTKALRWLDV
ncbi:ROK family protein [Arachidicoccus terrestris]|uniref:ROK family protein n=1 Tax=Arachidicoccus terrestris TaxID=2875539 RepID=UPI001CC6BCC8|nr:ROK family protein [Arachidicoccus terrestris]